MMHLKKKNFQTIRMTCMRTDQEIEVSKIKQLMSSGAPVSEDIIYIYLKIFCTKCLGMNYHNLQFFHYGEKMDGRE